MGQIRPTGLSNPSHKTLVKTDTNLSASCSTANCNSCWCHYNATCQSIFENLHLFLYILLKLIYPAFHSQPVLNWHNSQILYLFLPTPNLDVVRHSPPHFMPPLKCFSTPQRNCIVLSRVFLTTLKLCVNMLQIWWKQVRNENLQTCSPNPSSSSHSGNGPPNLWWSQWGGCWPLWRSCRWWTASASPGNTASAQLASLTCSTVFINVSPTMRRVRTCPTYVSQHWSCWVLVFFSNRAVWLRTVPNTLLLLLLTPSIVAMVAVVPLRCSEAEISDTKVDRLSPSGWEMVARKELDSDQLPVLTGTWRTNMKSWYQINSIPSGDQVHPDKLLKNWENIQYWVANCVFFN